MKYRITIDIYKGANGSGYNNWEEIYQQTVPDIEIGQIANLVNKVYETDTTPVVVVEGEQE